MYVHPGELPLAAGKYLPEYGDPMMAEVVYGVADSLVRHHLAVLLIQQDRDQPGLQVMAMNDIGALIRPQHELERRLGKEREPLCVVAVPVQTVPAEEVASILVSLAADWVLLIGVTLAIQNYGKEVASTTGVPRAQIFIDAAGLTLGKLLLLIAISAQLFCGMSSVPANSRPA